MHPILAAAIPDRPTFLQSVSFQLNGLIVVFVALSLIWLMLEVTGFYFKRAAKKAASAAVPAPVAAVVPAAVAPTVDELPPELVAAVAAAVHIVCGAQARIQAIVPVAAQDWAQEGRRQIFASHQIR